MTDTKSLTNAIAEFYHGEWGFVGTRAGMTDSQLAYVYRLLKAGSPLVLRHGGAYGADYEAHEIWRKLELKSIANVWPDDDKRALLFVNQPRVKVEPVMSTNERNVEIVKRSSFLLAAPNKEYEESKSATWQTIRVAMKFNRPIFVLWPSGKLTLCRDCEFRRIFSDLT